MEIGNLNLCDNMIETISNLSHLPKLTSLALKRNRIGVHGPSDYIHLSLCQHVTSLDLTDNKISEVEILEVLAKMSSLKVLYLHQNPVCK